MNGHAENEKFARLIDALHPWLGEAVIIGGWARRLYRIHPVAQAIAYVSIGTLDTDVAIPARLRLDGGAVARQWIRRRTAGARQTTSDALSPAGRRNGILGGVSNATLRCRRRTG
jgi:hypothetical protein